MRQVRFGSYSMLATVAGTPSLCRRKSMTRYCCLWPPPRWRAVLRPWLLRPPVRDFLASSDFSGVVRVTSAKSETVWNRRPGLVGLRLRSAISTCLEDLDLALGEGDDGPLGVGQLDLDRALASPLGLALAVGGVHLADLDLGPDRL